ncbi:uncharacterized protein LOC124995850 [Mugil cephalus]|uniref:uncharacterized protein LOC124995850 n=1 Tax=Mugil cephalus TaxID=48193 RepID=UPI001FB70E28|nr:uncharacterized protein LOC124995850 [Mugil cephalus]
MVSDTLFFLCTPSACLCVHPVSDPSLPCSHVSDPNPDTPPQPTTDPPSSNKTSHSCYCSAFCNTTSQFYTTRINVTNSGLNITSIKSLLLRPNPEQPCSPQSLCYNYSKILQHYKGAHVECHGTEEKLYICMVTLEMSGPVNVSALNKLVQQNINTTSMTVESPPARMMVCGPPGLSVHDLLASNLTWLPSNMSASDICQPEIFVFEW